MKNIIIIFLSLVLLSYTLSAVGITNTALLQEAYGQFSESGMATEYSQICRPADNTNNRLLLKQCLSDFPRLSDNKSYDYQTPETEYPLTEQSRLKAWDLTNKTKRLLQNINRLLIEDTFALPGPEHTPYLDSDNEDFKVVFSAVRAKCMLALESGNTDSFLQNFQSLMKFMKLRTRCMRFYDLYFIRIPFLNNPKFIHDFLLTKNQELIFYQKLLSSLKTDINFPEDLKRSTNIGALYLLHRLISIPDDQVDFSTYLQAALQRIAHCYIIFSKPYPSGIKELREFNKTHPQGTHNQDYAGMFFSAYGPDLSDYTWSYQAQRDLERARIMTALAIYRKTHNAYPNNLDALAPGILEKLPNNPMTCKPFRYTVLQNGGYELKDK